MSSLAFGPGVAMLTNPLFYSMIIALCTLAREIVRCQYRYRDLKFLLEKTRDPRSLRYLAQLEEARRSRTAISTIQLFTAWLLEVSPSTLMSQEFALVSLYAADWRLSCKGAVRIVTAEATRVGIALHIAN
jgi:hypothetical protein